MIKREVSKLLKISPSAREVIEERVREVDRSDLLLRVEIVGRSEADFRYRLSFIPEPLRGPDDLAFTQDGLQLVVDPVSARYLDGAHLDYQPDRGFEMDNPNPLWHEPAAAEIHELIESKINPAIALHSGQVTLLDLRDGIAYVSMGGGCQGCGLASVTLRQGVEKMITEAVPSVRSIVDTTDHSRGTHPYFQPETAGESPLA